MVFRPEEVLNFLDTIWEVNKEKIGAFPGCTSVELLRDEAEPNVYYTLSRWHGGIEALEAYRHSELFKGVWSRTRVLFADRPQAFSLVKPE